MVTIKSYSDLQQSKKLAEILPLESADMYYFLDPTPAGNIYHLTVQRVDVGIKNIPQYNEGDIPCWSLASLLGVLPEINSIPLTLEKVKAEDGYEGYYYHIEYKDIVLIPYSKNPIDACVAMIEKLHELKIL